MAGSVGAQTEDGADEVTLTSRDGGLSFTGTLLDFDGEFYRVQTIYGPLTLDGTRLSCGGPGCPGPEAFIAELTFSGAARMAEVLLPALTEAFATRHGLSIRREEESDRSFTLHLYRGDPEAVEMRLRFRTSYSAEGFADLLAEEADIVMSLREIRPEEEKRIVEAGLGHLSSRTLQRIIALDALVPVVSPANPLRKIELEQLIGIVIGDITDWSELGGPPGPIAVHLREAASGLSQGFADQFLKPRARAPVPGATRHDSDAALAAAVADDPLAFGVASYSVTGNTKRLPLSGPCGFVTEATPLTLRAEDYPLTMPLFLFRTARHLPPLARDFLAELDLPAAQVMVRRAGFVDQTPNESELTFQGLRLANAVEAAGAEIGLDELKSLVSSMRRSRRLSVSFRFEGGSAELDAQSQGNVDLLAREIRDGRFDGRRLSFVGFSDGVGPAASNLALSRSRAEAVRDAVAASARARALNGPKFRAEAFGEAMPLACDDSDWGRRTNRRVEVWVE